MNGNHVMGVISRDNTGWQDDFVKEIGQGYGVIWKNLLSDKDDVLPLLQDKIDSDGFFFFYNIANNYADYRFRVVDFATADSYKDKATGWKSKTPIWFYDNFEDYDDGKKHAVVAFLVDEVKVLQGEERLHSTKFQTYNNKQASVQNAVAYTRIITNKDIVMNDFIEFLSQNLNLILTGAPGTGKTYLAKRIAKQMIFGEVKDKLTEEEEKQFNEQCGFVQFHPSYDYTDFVEGLRPIQDEDGQVGFERRDGVFKAFCKKAIDASVERGQDNFDEVWDRLIDDLNESTYMEIPILSGKRNIHIELNDYGTGLTERMYDDVDAEKIKGHSKFFTKEQLYNVYRGFRGIPSGGHDNYRKAIIQYLRDKKGLLEYSKGQEVSEKKKYIFIIDEINRGEISKIFGELFFSIDPGYRGKEKGKVKTQYQNMVGQDDIFYDGFYVPENVCIIGTMNDIDRSVESMDFAFRRRFAFKEIKATDRVEMLYDANNGLGDNADEAKEKMEALNETIEKIEGLSSAYHIGPAYFLNLKNYGGNFDQLWENHLEGLLFEYLRGTQNIKEKMDKLYAAYNNESASDNG